MRHGLKYIGLGLATVYAALSGCALDRVQIKTDRAAMTAPDGIASLERAESLGDFVRLASYFDTQINTSYCGVATSTMVLNASGVKRPKSPPHGDASYFTQDNVFDNVTEDALSPSKVRRTGMTLEELGMLLTANGLQTQQIYAEDTDIDHTRRLVRDALLDPDAFVIANYHRPSIGQPGPGHISPLAAYDLATDRVLILDVSRYKYEPLWLEMPVLWKGLQAIDSDSGRSRGLVIARRPQL